jgi:hypothetical protein
MAYKDPEKKRENARKWYAEHREKTLEHQCEYAREHRARNPEKVRERDREYREKHREKIREYTRRSHVKHRDDRRGQNLWCKYGLTLAKYDEMVVAQAGRCAICGRGGERLHVDHSHSTGTVRGLLCHQCNKALGLLQDNSSLLREAARYLEKEQ